MPDPNVTTCSTCHQAVPVAPRCSVCGALLFPVAMTAQPLPGATPFGAPPPQPQPPGLGAPPATLAEIFAQLGVPPGAPPVDPASFGGAPVSFAPPPPPPPPPGWSQPQFTAAPAGSTHTESPFIAALRHGFVDARDIKGRTSREPFWYLAAAIVALVLMVLPMIQLDPNGDPNTRIGMVLILSLPLITAAVRRLHDLGKPGSWLAIAMVASILSLGLPLVALAIFFAQPGTPGDNHYGPPYRGPSKPGWW